MTRVTARRGRRVVPVLLPLVGLLLIVPPSGAGEASSFAGTVRSSVGAVLEGVEVLVVARPAALSPVVAATTDIEGRFRIAELSPGVYRVAALKHGYASFVGDVDTRLERWIELILRPHAGLSGERLAAAPDDASWTLRLPRRHVLRETESSVLDPPATDSGSRGERLSLQVDQLFAVAPSLEARRPGDPTLRGVETRLRLASRVGERGRVQARAHRENVDSAGAAGDDAMGLSVAFAYDTGIGGQFAVDTYYRQRDLHWAPAPTGSVQFLEQEHRSWGGRSGWSKQLDPASRLAFSVEYQDSESRLPPEIDAGPPGTNGSPVVNTSVGAAGSYATLRSEVHQVQVDFRARSLDTSLSNQRVASHGLPVSLGGVEGVTLGLDARDTWRLGGSFSLIYGLGFNHSLQLEDSSLIVPRLGGSWSFDDAAFSVLLSYHTVADRSGGPALASSGPFRPARALGYETRLDLPFGESLRLTGSTSYTPIQFDLMETLRGPEAVPIYLTNGNAEVYRNRLAFERTAGSTRTYAELAQGRAEGMLATSLPYEIPFQDLSQRRLNYLNGRVGVRIVPIGTHFVVEYRQVEEWRAAEFGPDSSTQQKSLELKLIQDLMLRRDLGHWRLLMDLRVASMETDSEDWLTAGNQAIVDALGGRLRAGLSVEF